MLGELVVGEGTVLPVVTPGVFCMVGTDVTIGELVGADDGEAGQYGTIRIEVLKPVVISMEEGNEAPLIFNNTVSDQIFHVTGRE